MKTVSVKFYGKNANEGKFADFTYIGSASCDEKATTAELINIGEGIGGPVNGPMMAQVEHRLIVLKA